MHKLVIKNNLESMDLKASLIQAVTKNDKCGMNNNRSSQRKSKLFIKDNIG
jgi:hypothetical protein